MLAKVLINSLSILTKPHLFIPRMENCISIGFYFFVPFSVQVLN